MWDGQGALHVLELDSVSLCVMTETVKARWCDSAGQSKCETHWSAARVFKNLVYPIPDWRHFWEDLILFIIKAKTKKKHEKFAWRQERSCEADCCADLRKGLCRSSSRQGGSRQDWNSAAAVVGVSTNPLSLHCIAEPVKAQGECKLNIQLLASRIKIPGRSTVQLSAEYRPSHGIAEPATAQLEVSASKKTSSF